MKATETCENSPETPRNSLESAVCSGDYRARLKGLRDTLAASTWAIMHGLDV